MENNIYQENGFENRQAYLESLSENYGLDQETIFCLADLLGPAEDFDGLIVSLEDVEMGS